MVSILIIVRRRVSQFERTAGTCWTILLSKYAGSNLRFEPVGPVQFGRQSEMQFHGYQLSDALPICLKVGNLDARSKIPDPKTKIQEVLDPRSEVLDPRSKIQDPKT